MKPQPPPVPRVFASHRLTDPLNRFYRRLARARDVRHLAVMADVHPADPVPVGTVLATSNLLYPQAVGADIGCGLATRALDPPLESPLTEETAHRILADLRRAIPILKRPTPTTDRPNPHQFGTLGRGNHFIELQVEVITGRPWILVHCGSRQLGHQVLHHHLKHAGGRSAGLAWLDAETPAGRRYLLDQEEARAWARENRARLLKEATDILATHLGLHPDPATLLDRDHNHLKREHHLGMDLWVHRKGAQSLPRDRRAPLPGSMGTSTFHVRGRGCPRALDSCAHGAGRAVSRHRSTTTITPDRLRTEMAGIHFDTRRAHHLIGEAPSAYKDIRQVLKAQRQLLSPIRELIPLLNYKAGGR